MFKFEHFQLPLSILFQSRDPILKDFICLVILICHANRIIKYLGEEIQSELCKNVFVNAFKAQKYHTADILTKDISPKCPW